MEGDHEVAAVHVPGRLRQGDRHRDIVVLLGLWQGRRDGRDSEGVVADAFEPGVRWAVVSGGARGFVNSPVLEVDRPRPGLVGDVASKEDCCGDYGQEKKS